jgi:hypothetical protein
MPDPIPEDAVWFDPLEFQQMVARWLVDLKGVPYAQDAMDAAHGEWGVKRK